MKQEEFITTVRACRPWLKGIEKAAFEIHERVNQKYGGILPYGFHLKLTASYVTKYGHLIATDEVDIFILYAAAYLHDTIEDARMTYHDVVDFIRDFNTHAFSLPEAYIRQIEQQVPEIVYALTNEKGRTRAERADDVYYKGIRETPFAAFIKMCDRLANIKYTTLFVLTDRMFNVYKNEYPRFIQAIGEGAIPPLPEAMKEEAEKMLDSEVYVMKG